MIELEKDAASIDRENAIKSPFFTEHKAMGLKAQSGEITQAEWIAYEKDWCARLFEAMAPALLLRTYTEVEV